MASFKIKINKEKFCLISRPHLDINLDEFVPEDWLTHFTTLCGTNTYGIPAHRELNRHLDPDNYPSQPPLIRSLKFHYAVLSGALKELDPAFQLTEDQKTGVITKINEGLEACTPGFHARIDSILEGYFSPKTIDEYLYSIRYNIVERAANKKTSEVHANNRFFILAQQLGFAVQPKLSTDGHHGDIRIKVIDELLKQAFKEQYQPFSILYALKEMILSGFEQYIGRNQKGYSIAFYEPVLERLKHLFKEEAPNFELHLVTDEETSEVVDINWAIVLQKLWNILIAEKYFYLKNKSATILPSKARADREREREIISLVSDTFVNSASLTPDNIKTLSDFLVSEHECFAFLRCNPQVPNADKITLLFNTLNQELTKNPKYTDGLFWQFIQEQPSLIEPFITNYPPTSGSKLYRTPNQITEPLWQFHRGHRHLTPNELKGLILRLRFLPPQEVTKTLQQTDSSGATFLYRALEANIHDAVIVNSLIELLQNQEELTLKQILSIENNTRKNLFLMMLSMNVTGLGKTQAVHQLLTLITSLDPYTVSSIVQLKDSSNPNGLLLAITHCPAAVPSLLQILLTYDIPHQNRITSTVISHALLKGAPGYAIVELLKLNKKVNFLAEDPTKQVAYQAAQRLQESLIRCLDDYYKSTIPPTEAFATLQSEWHEAINVASGELDKLPDWRDFLANLALIVLSIPLFGIPLAINYYASSGKHVLFQPAMTSQLERLDQLVEQESLFRELEP